jgi:hypothetical protein
MAESKLAITVDILDFLLGILMNIQKTQSESYLKISFVKED